jgi:hypothetical protein
MPLYSKVNTAGKAGKCGIFTSQYSVTNTQEAYTLEKLLLKKLSEFESN